MKQLFFLILLASVSAFGQTPKVKQKIEKRLNQAGQVTTQIVEDFNDQGYRLKRSVLDAYGKIKSYRTYNTDSTGLILADTGYNKNNEIVDIWSYEYDSTGEIIKQSRRYPKRGDVYIEIFQITYDSNNNIIEEKQFDKDLTLNWVYKYEYDDSNLKIRFISTFQGTIRNERIYKYKKGLKVEETLYDYENEELRQRENTLYFFKYGKSGELLKKTVHSVAEHLKEKIITEYKYSYDKEGNITAEIRNKNGKFDSKKIYDYKYW